MRKKIYIIPGWKESPTYKIYRSLASIAQKKNYEVVFYDINWNNKLSKQIFPINKNSIIFGFSLGAILALLISQKYECRKLILASMTPVRSFKEREMRKALVDLLGKDLINDITDNLKTKNKAVETIVMYGDKEGEPGDIIISKTGHRLNSRYIKKISELI